MERTERPIPTNLDAERATIGACLLERDAILVLAPIVQPDDFYLEKHAWIWEAILSCAHRRVPPDLSTVADELRRHERLEPVGGISYLADLSADCPTAVHGHYYADLVARTATLRRLIGAGGNVAALGYNEQQELDVTLDQAEQAVFAVTQRQRGSDFMPMAQIVDRYINTVTADEELMTPTGLLDLDRLLNGGLRPGNLVILAARPSVGKSALAQGIAYHVAVRQQQPVGFVSLEMTGDEITDRLIAQHTGLPAREVRQHAQAGHSQVIEALSVLHAAPLFIEQHFGATVMDVRSKARRLATQVPLALVVVDYIQLLVPGDTHNRVDEVSTISRQLKLLAGELQCPVLALSQLNRAVENRVSQIPRLSDLRDSGAIEQDADIVMFLHREELSDKETDKKGIADVHIAKQRNGALGVACLRFDGPTMRFQNLSNSTTIAGFDTPHIHGNGTHSRKSGSGAESLHLPGKRGEEI
jgi:replicative DNA helicase